MGTIYLKYKPLNRKNAYLVSEIVDILKKEYSETGRHIYLYSFGSTMSHGIDNKIMGVAFECANKSKGEYDGYYLSFKKELSILHTLEEEGILGGFDLDKIAKEIWLTDLDEWHREYSFCRYMYENNTSFIYKIMSSGFLFVLSLIVIALCVLISGFSANGDIIPYVFFSYIGPPIGMCICITLALLPNPKYVFLKSCIYTYIYLLFATCLVIFIYSFSKHIIMDEIPEIRKSILIWSVMLLTLPFLYFYENKCIRYCLSKEHLERYKKQEKGGM